MVPASVPAEALVGDGGEGLERALEDPLGADVDPGAGGHLAVHRQAEVLEPAELLPVRPVAHQVGVRDQHARRPLVGAHHADGLAALHEQRLVVLERGQSTDDRVVGLPRPGGTGKAARSWEAYDAIVRALTTLENDETLLVQSGKPVGVMRTQSGRRGC